MKIELATIQDVPAILDLQRKAFGPLCEELNWMDAPPLTETLEQACEEFAHKALEGSSSERYNPDFPIVASGSARVRT